MTTVTIPAPVGEILKTLEAAGYGAWCVGGCVRDALLDRMPGDWDVTTSARPEETMALFAGRAVPTGLRHGTVTVKTEQGGVEITTLRRDGAYRDHRRPETVTFTDSLEEDLRRRDFTINAMAADLQGTLYDPLGGRADLTEKSCGVWESRTAGSARMPSASCGDCGSRRSWGSLSIRIQRWPSTGTGNC